MFAKWKVAGVAIWGAVGIALIHVAGAAETELSLALDTASQVEARNVTV
jgi:hypothetical protein